MARHGLAPDTITINTLLDAFCSAGKLPQAWLLLESFH
jgi:pentatricopeptide repeat protein